MPAPYPADAMDLVIAEQEKVRVRLIEASGRVMDLETRLAEAKREAGEASRLFDELNLVIGTVLDVLKAKTAA